jgi:hypothetical protein
MPAPGPFAHGNGLAVHDVDGVVINQVGEAQGEIGPNALEVAKHAVVACHVGQDGEEVGVFVLDDGESGSGVGLREEFTDGGDGHDFGVTGFLRF